MASVAVAAAEIAAPHELAAAFWPEQVTLDPDDVRVAFGARFKCPPLRGVAPKLHDVKLTFEPLCQDENITVAAAAAAESIIEAIIDANRPLYEAGEKRSHPLPCGPAFDEDVGEPRRKASTTLTTHQPARSSLLSAERRRIWAHSPRPEYKSVTQQYSLANRCPSMLRPGLDICILPGGHAPTRAYWEWCQEEIGLEDWQVLFTPGTKYNMDEDTTPEMVEALKVLVAGSGGAQWTVIGYCATEPFLRWAEELTDLPGVEIFCETPEWLDEFGHKGCLHRRMSSLDTPCMIERIDPSIRVPRGYTCSTSEELQGAYKLLGGGAVVIKPVFGAAGNGILFPTTEEEIAAYEFPMGDVCLEEKLKLDLSPDGTEFSPAMHYIDGEWIGPDFLEQIMEGVRYVGWRKSAVSGAFRDESIRVLRKFLDASRPRGAGGVDFLSSNGEPYLSDMNTGRFNGAHVPLLFKREHAPDSTFFCFRSKPFPGLALKDLWLKLDAEGVCYHPRDGKSGRGVFPVMFWEGVASVWVAMGDSQEHCLELYQRTIPLLAEERGSLLKISHNHDTQSADAAPSNGAEVDHLSSN